MDEKRKKILVVDDEETVLFVFTTHLNAAGYDVVTASSGKAGLAAVEQESPDLVLLDVMMPEMNGFAVCRAIRDNPAWKKLPVVMITGLHGEADAQEGRQSGATDFMTKPVDYDDLTKRVRKFIGSPFK